MSDSKTGQLQQIEITIENRRSKLLTGVHHDVREYVKGYNAQCESQRGALVPHGLHDATDRLQVRLRCAVERGAQLRGPRCGL